MSNKMRITGLATGLDVDSLVKSMLKADNTKIDSLKQKRQLLLWKQEMYRDYLTDMTSLKNTYFNVAKQDTYMLSSKLYSGLEVTNAVSSTSSIATATASAGASAGTYNVKDITTALKASYSKAVSATMEADYPVQFPVKAGDITTSKYDKLTLNVNGTDYSINLSEDYGNLGALANSINQKLLTADNAGTPTDISSQVAATLSADGTSIKFIAKDGNTLNSVMDSAGAPLTDQKMNFKINVEAGVNDQLLINVSGTVKTITLAAGAYNDLSQLSDEINTKLTSAGLNTTVHADISPDGTRMKFSSLDASKRISINGTSANMLGFYGSNTELRTTLASKMSSLFTSDAAAKVSFTINGKDFKYDFSSTGADKDKSIFSVLSDISSVSGVKLSYSEIGSKFTMETLSTGQAQNLTAAEAADGSGGGFLQTLFGTRSINTTGRDATVTIKNPAGDSLTMTSSTNNISIDGMNITLFKDDTSATGVNFNVTSNPQKTYDNIKGFIDKYNEFVDKVQKDLTEKKQYGYQPLTDEQRKGMEEEDIKAWEAKTKEGLLKSDSTLQSMIYSMRRAFFDEVEGAGIKLQDLGLSTSNDYFEGGKITVDETKLKDAIKNNGQQVYEIFAKASPIKYDPDHKSDINRYKEIGIFQRIDDIIKDYGRTNQRDSNNKKGILVEKAGVKGDLTEFESLMSKQIKNDYDTKITELTKRLAQKENKYYKQFSQLEVAMQKMNSQSSWLTSQLSSLG